MYRYTRTVTIRNGASMPPTLQIGSSIVKHVNQVYGLNMRMGTALFDKLKVHWTYDGHSLDEMMKLSSKLSQDKTYWEMMDKLKPLVLEGSVKERLVAFPE